MQYSQYSNKSTYLSSCNNLGNEGTPQCSKLPMVAKFLVLKVDS